MQILVVEDEKRLADALAQILIEKKYMVDIANDGADGLDYALSGIYDVIILDVMLPGMDGYEILQIIRQKHSIPVLMMSARTDDQSKILGLDVGADDYLDKPFSFPVLSSKVKAILRRTYGMAEDKQLLVYKDITVDVASRTVTKAGKEISITGKEYDILCYCVY